MFYLCSKIKPDFSRFPRGFTDNRLQALSGGVRGVEGHGRQGAERMSADVETIVVGAGVVGLAVARALALTGHETMVLEQHALIGSEISSRNSEVIHAGIYYPPGSLRARLCVAGRQRLYDYCTEHGVTHNRLGKLIVAATEAQLPALAALKTRAEANGVTDLRPLSAAEASVLEPAVRVAG